MLTSGRVNVGICTHTIFLGWFVYHSYRATGELKLVYELLPALPSPDTHTAHLGGGFANLMSVCMLY